MPLYNSSKPVLLQGYGLTESCAIGSQTPADGDEFADHFGSAGMLSPGLEAMLVDPLTNKRMPPTQQGEIWLRGPVIMKGNKNTSNLLLSRFISNFGQSASGNPCFMRNDEAE